MAFLPELIGAIIIFVVGLIAAKLLKMAVVKLLKLVRLDTAAEKTNLHEFLKKGGIVKTASEIIGVLVYWFVMILVVIATLDAIGPSHCVRPTEQHFPLCAQCGSCRHRLDPGNPGGEPALRRDSDSRLQRGYSRC